jgi:predicted enzyme related to lactoylglutathione lyase
MSTHNNSEARVLSTGCLLVDNIDAVSSFFSQVFEGSSCEQFNSPVRHTVVRIEQSDDATMLLVSKPSCNPGQLSYFKDLSTSRQLYLVVKDPQKVQKNAVNAGAQIGDNCNDDNGSIYCSFDGPEEISFTVMNKIKSKTQYVHEMIIAMCATQQLEDEVTSPTSTLSNNAGKPLHQANIVSSPMRGGKKGVPPKPVIRVPSLDVSILSNGSRKEYVPCPANAREPVPFETEIFKGVALLVVRTKPEDPKYDCFFNGPKRYWIGPCFIAKFTVSLL